MPQQGQENRPLPPLVRDSDGAPIIAKLPNNPNSSNRFSRPEQPTRAQNNAGWTSVQQQGPAELRPSRPAVQWPAVQTVLSLGNGNRIVGTNIIRNDGQEIEVDENQDIRPDLGQITFTNVPKGSNPG